MPKIIPRQRFLVSLQVDIKNGPPVHAEQLAPLFDSLSASGVPGYPASSITVETLSARMVSRGGELNAKS